MKNIIISNPCNKDWNKMTQKGNGKYCGSCNKTVIDFATWEKAEIIEYLQGRNGKVCGHFNKLQIAIKRPKHHQFLVDLYFKTEINVQGALVKSISLSIIVLCMNIIGCNTPTTSEVMDNRLDTSCSSTKNKLIRDTDTVLQDDTVELPPIMGEVEIVNDTSRE